MSKLKTECFQRLNWAVTAIVLDENFHQSITHTHTHTFTNILCDLPQNANTYPNAIHMFECLIDFKLGLNQSIKKHTQIIHKPAQHTFGSIVNSHAFIDSQTIFCSNVLYEFIWCFVRYHITHICAIVLIRW